MIVPFPEQCLECKHLHRRAPGLAAVQCDAFPFPEVIPAKILEEHFDHRNPLPGDRGIRFEPLEQPAIAESVSR
ncbi:MAG TPA: hypothetical protein VHX12_08575 [Acidisoma sp.]|nr:hypothetical protein [Acidisoma sp.]